MPDNLEKAIGNVNIDAWKDRLSRGRSLRLPLKTKDMEPIVMAGDTLEFTEVSLIDLKVNDLVLLYSGGNLRLRIVRERVTSDSGDQFMLEAVNVPHSLAKYGFNDILAKAQLIERDGARVWTRGEGFWLAKLRRLFIERKKMKDTGEFKFWEGQVKEMWARRRERINRVKEAERLKQEKLQAEQEAAAAAAAAAEEEALASAAEAKGAEVAAGTQDATPSVEAKGAAVAAGIQDATLSVEAKGAAVAAGTQDATLSVKVNGASKKPAIDDLVSAMADAVALTAKSADKE